MGNGESTTDQSSITFPPRTHTGKSRLLLRRYNPSLNFKHFLLPQHQEPLLLHHHHHDLDESVENDDEDDDTDFCSSNPRPLHRCRTAPAMVIIKDLRRKTHETKKPSPISKSIINQGTFLLIIYLTLGVSIYSFNRDHYSGIETHPVVDALIHHYVHNRYGDIAPLTPWTKIFAVVFVLFGFGFLDILLSVVVNYVLDLQESMILTGIQVGSSSSRHHHHRFSG